MRHPAPTRLSAELPDKTPCLSIRGSSIPRRRQRLWNWLRLADIAEEAVNQLDDDRRIQEPRPIRTSLAANDELMQPKVGVEAKARAMQSWRGGGTQRGIVASAMSFVRSSAPVSALKLPMSV